jgi:hypothetical protein
VSLSVYTFFLDSFVSALKVTILKFNLLYDEWSNLAGLDVFMKVKINMQIQLKFHTCTPLSNLFPAQAEKVDDKSVQN